LSKTGPGQKVLRPYLKTIAKKGWGYGSSSRELPSKNKALNSNPSTVPQKVVIIEMFILLKLQISKNT
jgi:hypothetical protein